MDVLGVILMFLGVCGIALGVVLSGWTLFRDTTFGRLCMAFTPYALRERLLAQNGAATTVAFPRSSSPEREPVAEQPAAVVAIETAQKGRFLRMDGREEQVQGTAMLEELQFFGADKNDKRHVSPSGDRLREFKALFLAGKQLLLEHPVAEGGACEYFLYQSAEAPQGFSEYLRGSPPEAPGPVAQFAASKQRDTISIEALGKAWILRDIIWVDVAEHNGRFFVRSDRSGGKPRLAMLLARNEEEWLLWADLRSGQGSDTLWVGRKCNPEDEIEL